MRAARQANNRQPPTAIGVLAGAPDNHLVKVGPDRVITDSQEPGKRCLEPAIFAPVARSDRDSPKRQRPTLFQQILPGRSHGAKAAEPVQDEHRRGMIGPIAHQQLAGLAIERQMNPYRALRMPDHLAEREKG